MKPKYVLSDSILKAEGLVRDENSASGYRLANVPVRWTCPCCGDWQEFKIVPVIVKCENVECGWQIPPRS
jgi:hypothetical protein